MSETVQAEPAKDLENGAADGEVEALRQKVAELQVIQPETLEILTAETQLWCSIAWTLLIALSLAGSIPC